MDYILYNLLGYVTNDRANHAATVIQRAYRDHVSYELTVRADVISRLVPVRDSFDPLEEFEYWNQQRALIRHGLQWVKL